MLRRSKTIVFDNDPDAGAETVQEPRRPTLRRTFETPRNAAPRPVAAPADTDRDGEASANPVNQRFDQLRAELEEAPITRGAQESLAALREEFRRKHVGNDEPSPALSVPGLPWRGIKPSRLLLILVALVAGGLAAYLALSRPGEAPPPAPEPVVEEAVAPPPEIEILVARDAIAAGTRLAPELLQWQRWPADLLSPGYITAEATPEGLNAFGNSAARGPLAAGEPIVRDKLREGGNSLSFMLERGTRAVSVAVDAKSASGGFIVPGDRVDVMLTSMSGGTQSSRTIVANARVLAINADLGLAAEGESAEQQLFSSALATLELSPAQAELVVNASIGGILSLVLRPMDEGPAMSDAALAQQPVNQTIRLTSPFWTGTNDTPVSGGTAPAF